MSRLAELKRKVTNVLKNEQPIDQHLSNSNRDISTGDYFTVQYLSYVQLKQPGLDEICESVNDIYLKAKPLLKTVEKCALSMSKEGVLIRPLSPTGENSDSAEGNLYKPRRILYCGVDRQHQKVFSFNYQFGPKSELVHLHVIMCKSKDEAKAIAKGLSEIFREISVELHRREKDNKRKHSQVLNRSRSSISNISSCSGSVPKLAEPSFGSETSSSLENAGTWESGHFHEPLSVT